jgi:mannose-6-phosphate isomerase-like protein (cupin superfamily)
MDRHNHARSIAAFALDGRSILLARDGTCSAHDSGAGGAGGASALDGRLLALHRIAGPADVHYPVWEMHPEGDELLILVSGGLAVEYRVGGAERRTALEPGAALSVPAGHWHRLAVEAPSVMIAITPRRGTVHRSG